MPDPRLSRMSCMVHLPHHRNRVTARLPLISKAQDLYPLLCLRAQISSNSKLTRRTNLRSLLQKALGETSEIQTYNYLV